MPWVVLTVLFCGVLYLVVRRLGRNRHRDGALSDAWVAQHRDTSLTRH